MYMIRPQIAIWADQRSTCMEIARAIIEQAKDPEHAQAIWEGEAKDYDHDKLLARAWELADPEETKLWWGSWCEDRPVDKSTGT